MATVDTWMERKKVNQCAAKIAPDITTTRKSFHPWSRRLDFVSNATVGSIHNFVCEAVSLSRTAPAAQVVQQERGLILRS
jgi:hypothetical protein